MGGAYYNEIDGYAAQWLRNLIAAGLIPAGDVDERSIVDVQADDVRGYTQCHWFAGLGGWAYAARLAGWPDDKPIWTGSCPCQPLSSAGLRKGHADERHLWPAFYRLIAECSPPIVFGEQVASRDGREWLAGIRADLESLGYACGAADLSAAGVGAPHVRQRLYWVADASGGGREQGAEIQRRGEDQPRAFDGGKGNACGPWPATAGLPRRIEPGLVPLADGVPARVGRLRAYGGAVVPQITAEFVTACMGCLTFTAAQRNIDAGRG
jgi:DNA (cytosine-5)-methyltransferase 1